MWSGPSRDVEQRRHQPLTFFVYWRFVTLLAYRHDVKRGSTVPWLFQDLRQAIFNFKYKEN